ncbi:MAG: SH3 domain-containing protein, partial [Anaerolineae bacterium]
MCSRLALLVCSLALYVLTSACRLAGAPVATLIPTASPLPSATAIPPSPTPDERIWGIVLLSENETLPLRAAPTDEAEVVAELPAQTVGLRLRGEERSWRQVLTPDGLSGWMPARYLTELVPAAQFCGDERVAELLHRFSAAVQQRDGDALQALVSPAHGLTVRINWW